MDFQSNLSLHHSSNSPRTTLFPCLLLWAPSPTLCLYPPCHLRVPCTTQLTMSPQSQPGTFFFCRSPILCCLTRPIPTFCLPVLLTPHITRYPEGEVELILSSRSWTSVSQMQKTNPSPHWIGHIGSSWHGVAGIGAATRLYYKLSQEL